MQELKFILKCLPIILIMGWLLISCYPQLHEAKVNDHRHLRP